MPGEGGGVGGGNITFRLLGDASGATEALSRVRESLADVAKVAAGFAIGSMALGAVSSVEQLFGSVTELGEATHNLQLETGATAEQASGMLAVFERWGVSNEQASVALGIFSKNIEQFTDKSQKAQSAATGFSGVVDQLGLKVQDSSGAILPMSNVLSQVADKFASMPDGIQKTNDAMVLFGRSGRDMIEVLNQGSAGIAAAEATAKQYGLVLSEDNVAAVYKFGQAQRDLSEAVKGFAVQVGSLVLPALTSFVEGVTNIAASFNQTVLPVLRTVVDYVSNTFGPYIQAGIQIAGEAFNELAGIVSGALGSVLDIVVSVGQAIYDALSWLNPFATHSPSLVSQVSDGVASITDSYGNLTQIDGPLGDAGAAVQQFAENSKKSLQGMVDSTKTQLDEVRAALSQAKDDLNNWSATPIQGTKAFQDQLDTIDTQSSKIRLQMDQIKLGSDVGPQVAALNEQLKQLQLNAPQSPIGGTKEQRAAFQQDSRAHQDAIRGIKEQIDALKTGGAQGQLQALQDQLDKLATQADALKLQEHLQLDPLRKQLEQVAHPTQAEQPFEKILQGMQNAQSRISTLAPEESRLNDLLKVQEQALSNVAKAAGPGGAAGAHAALQQATNPLNDTIKNVKESVAQWSDKVQEARSRIEALAASITGPVKSAFDALKGYLSPDNKVDLMGSLFGGDIGHGIDEWVRGFKSALSSLGGLGNDLKDALSGKGINFADIAKNIGTYLSSALQADLGLAEGLGLALLHAVQKIDWPGIWKSVTSVATTVTAWLEGEWAKIDWAKIWASAKQLTAGIVTAGGNLLGIVGAWLADTWAKIDWSAIWAAVTTLVSTATAWVSSRDWTATAAALDLAVGKAIDAVGTQSCAVTFSQKLGMALHDIDWSGVFLSLGAVQASIDGWLRAAAQVDYMPIGEYVGQQIGSALRAVLTHPEVIANVVIGFVGLLSSALNIANEAARVVVKAGWDIGAGLIKGIVESLIANLPSAIAGVIRGIPSSIGSAIAGAVPQPVAGGPSLPGMNGFSPPAAAGGTSSPQITIVNHNYGGNTAQIQQATYQGTRRALGLQ